MNYLDVPKRIDTLPNVKKLGEMIEKATMKHLLPATLAVYNRGEPVVFGKLQLQNGVVTIDGCVM